MKKKVMVSTLAASLVLGSLSGIPLSQGGLFQKLNLSGIAQAASEGLPSDKVIEQIRAIYNQLNEEEKALLDSALLEIKQLDPQQNTDLISPIWNKIEASIEDPEAYPDLTERNMVWLIQQLAVSYDENLSELERVRTDPEVRKILVQLASLAGVSGITIADLDAFQEQLYVELENSVKSNLGDLITALVTGKFEESSSKVFLGAINGLLAKDLKISEVTNSLNITAADLEAVRESLVSAVDADYTVQKILGGAVVRNKVDFSYSTENNGRRLVPSLVLFGTNLASFVTWEVTSGDSAISVSGNNFVLRSSANQATASIRATIKLPNYNLDLYRGTITMKGTGSGNNPGSGGGGGPIGGVPSTPTDGDIKAPVVENALQRINSVVAGLANQLRGLTENQRNGQASEIVAEAVRAASFIDLSETVSVEDGVARPTFAIDDLEESFERIKEIVAQANEQLLAEVPGAKKVKAIAVLDFGKVDADRIELPIDKELLDLAAANQIAALSFVVNGVSITVDINQLRNDTLLVVEPQEPSSVPGANGLRLASDLYNLEFVSQGSVISGFSQPVELRIPVTSSAAGSDKELLVIANLDEEEPVIKGGRFDLEGKHFIAFTKQFSTYGVIENRKTFTDIASVAQWAGQAIETAAAHGILEGRAEGEFVPQEPVTRAEFAKMIVKVFGLEDIQASASQSFADVQNSDWFQPYVAAASAAGIVNGRSEDRFEPNAYVTRAEMAVMASRALVKTRGYLVSEDVETALSRFVDAAEIHSTLQEGVGLSAQEGIIEGEENNRFNPNEQSTRAQAAVVIYRLLSK